MGGLRTTTGDILDVHAYILPLDLLLNKLLFRSALRLCSLPKLHPLHDQLRAHSIHRAKRHLSPIHHLLRLARLNLKSIEVVVPFRRSPSYSAPFSFSIPASKDEALPLTRLTKTTAPVRIYSDGSGFKGGIGALALLYISDRLVKTLWLYLGTDKEHTVYEAEGVGLAMGLYMLKGLNIKLTHPTVLGSDGQAVIRALDNQRSHSGQYILDNALDLAESLHRKQDGLINHAKRAEVLARGKIWKGRSKGVVDLQVHWVPGHSDFAPNKRADKEAKKASQGDSSDAKLLPRFLRKCLLLSISALRQDHLSKQKKRWGHRWKSSPRANLLRSINNSTPSKKYLRLIAGLNRRQSSILFQLRTGHIGLNHHLFCICRSESPICPNCQGFAVKMVKHYLLECSFFQRERFMLRRKLRWNANSLSFLLSSPVAVLPLLKYVHATGRFKSHFGKKPEDQIQTNARCNAELRLAAEQFEAVFGNIIVPTNTR
jgi:ribonuclease HI